MSVTDYETRFSELSCHALMIVPTDAERVRRFVTGLYSGIQATMVQEVEMGISYGLVVEIAWRIEGVRQRSCEQAARDKQFQYSGEFSGASAGGKGQCMRGQSSRPPYPAPPPPRGAPVRPYFSAMLESSYHPPAIQGSFRGLRGIPVQQGQQRMITALVASPVVRPPRGGRKVGRGYPRGGGQLGGGYPDGALARFYDFPARADVVASGAVITGTISVCGREASVLFDPGSAYFYVSFLFAHFLGVSRESLGTLVYVSTPVGDSIIVDRIYRSCIVTFCGHETRVDLQLLDMIDFEIILGMDLLSPYHAILDFHAKTVTLAMSELPRLQWKGSSTGASSRVIFFLKARHILEKGCLAYLAYVRDTTAEETTTIDSVAVV
ncbi:uncharacterized protein [Nicotiana tomentosiformis]|uniref:uncharacterized protein n=1 Tax=Nicotiana tomentosiformis TaxID=4098 RepID=UPI00388C4859